MDANVKSQAGHCQNGWQPQLWQPGKAEEEDEGVSQALCYSDVGLGQGTQHQVDWALHVRVQLAVLPWEGWWRLRPCYTFEASSGHHPTFILMFTRAPKTRKIKVMVKGMRSLADHASLNMKIRKPDSLKKLCFAGNANNSSIYVVVCEPCI